MRTSWSALPEDVKWFIAEPLNRIDRGSLRQCSWSDKLFIDSVSKPIREIIFNSHRSYIQIKYDEDYQDSFENTNGTTIVKRSEKWTNFTTFSMSEDFQTIAWRSLQKMLKSQNNEINSMTFCFFLSLNFNSENNDPERTVPGLPEEILKVRNLSICLDASDEMTCRIVKFAKPGIEYLDLSMTVKNVTVPSEIGDLDQVKTARNLHSRLMSTFEQSLKFEGDGIQNKTTLLTDENIVGLLKKSLITGKPSKFHYHRMWPDVSKIVSSFESVSWSTETSGKFENLRDDFKIDLAKKNFILSSEVFVQFTKFSVSGFLLKKQ